MKRIRALSFAFAALTGVVAGLPLTIHADDTEIYVGNRAFSEGVRPNILLILDTSGSMAAFDGEPLDRLDRVKTALNAILDEVNDMNIGLARFHTPGGPILFPVSYVDADARDVELGLIPEINKRLVGSANDAEELVSTSAMVLDSTQLEMTASSAFGTEKSTVLTVSQSLDDASQASAASPVDTTSTSMNCCIGQDGLRFQSVPIPPGSVVTRATLEIQSSQDDAGATTITFDGHLTPNSLDFSTSDIFTRARTTASVTWTTPDWVTDTPVFSPNLRTVIQEIVAQGTWATNNSLSLFMKGVGSRVAKTYDAGGMITAANLYLDWVEPPIVSGDQIIGLRFTDVRVPQKQGIKSAVIEFVPSEDAVTTANLEIHGEAADDSAPFTTVAGNISSRTPTLNKVPWTPVAADWKEGIAQTTPDITAIVQEIVDRPGWCGGNAMAFGIDDLGATGPLIAAAFDRDPSLAPILRIDFDTTRPPGAGEGCTVQDVTARPGISTDDANQNTSLTDDALYTMENFVQLDANRENGLRYQLLGIPKGAVILEASLVIEAGDPGIVPQILDPTASGALTVNISAESIDTAPEFSSGLNTDVITRTAVPVSVPWVIPAGTPWTVGDSVTSPDFKNVIDAVVNGVAGWDSEHDLALLLSATGSGSRVGVSYDDSPADAPQLRVKIQVNVGDLPSVPVTTVRDRLKQIVNDELDHAGTTPIVDNLYEAMAYFRGDPVKWGLNRGTSGDYVRRSTRVSHPASYTGGTVVRDPGCTDLNLNAQACVTEHITGDPDYISPIDTECQSNFIVLLTDGLANRNSSKGLIRTTTGDAACATTLPDPPGGPVASREECGLEVTSFLYDTNNDQSPTVPGPNEVTTYTIGLNISNDWLEQLADVGGGEFREAGNTASVRKTFNDITSEILQRTSSFSTPSLSINSFNRLFHLNEVYFALFEPLHKTAWPGNVKKYQICSDPDSVTCEIGDILDLNGDQAIDADKRIDTNAQSYWPDPNSANQPDGATVTKGGAANAVELPPRHVSRRVFTFTGSGRPQDVLGGTDLVTADKDHEIRDDNADGILDGITAGTADENLQRTKDLLGWPGDAVATLTATERADLVTALHNHIQWIRGQDVDDEIPNGDTTEDRYSFYDPLHSSALAFTVGGTSLLPVVKVVIGTNDGGVRLINGTNGYEEFVFYPQSTLRRLPNIRSNPQGDHGYGVDGNATVWLNDVNQDGIIDRGDGDFARVFIGQRRGGNEIYAFDVTPTTVAKANDTDAVNGIEPVYMWRIRGGSAQYPRLGQTWSRPKLATVTLANTPDPGDLGPVTALFFGGGYDDGQDSGFGPGGVGNAIYMADPETGERWLSVSANDPGGGDKVVVPNNVANSIDVEPKMTFPIPSDLGLLDSNGDGSTDRIYVGDMGGQLWRVDLKPADPANPASYRSEAVVGRLGMVSGDQTLADQRKFFEAPDVVQVRGGLEFSSVANYDLVTIVSGNRANPLNRNVQDRFFAFRDPVIGSMQDDPLPFGDGNADNFTTLRGALDSPLIPGDLFDVTDIVDPEGTDLSNLQNADGYYIDFVDTGEKGLSSPIVLGGKVFFTTYLPEQVVNVAACKLAEGAGLLYGIDVLNGTAVFNWDQSPDTDPLSIADRRMTLGAGIPSSAVPIFQPDGISLLIGGSSGGTVVKPGLELPRSRTFWFQETGL